MRTLLVGPYVGEIGWELMSWQGRVRLRFHEGHFDRLVVVGAAGREAFYGDMPLDYRAIDLSSIPGRAYEDCRAHLSTCEPIRAAQLHPLIDPLTESLEAELEEAGHEVETFQPEYSGILHPCDQEHQRFIQFQRPTEPILPAPWVVLVQRTREHGASNWTTAEWDDLKARLNSQGIHTSLFPNESAAAIGVLSHCDLAVGQSTGGLHLASLCGCPHIEWSPDNNRPLTAWEMTTRQRYETYWNPLGTPVICPGGPDLPSPKQAVVWITKALRRIGRRTGSAVSRTLLRQKWRVRSGIVGGVIRGKSFRQWPWRVQRMVRSHCV